MEKDPFDQIFTHWDGEVNGPYTLEELKAGIKNNLILSHYQVWFEGCGEDYVDIRSIPGVSKVFEEYIKEREKSLSLSDLLKGIADEQNAFASIG